jgi:hypothetical protein
MSFCVNEEQAASIHEAYIQGGELSAAVELRRLFPGLANNEATLNSARTIAGWQPRPWALVPRNGRYPNRDQRDGGERRRRNSLRRTRLRVQNRRDSYHPQT